MTRLEGQGNWHQEPRQSGRRVPELRRETAEAREHPEGPDAPGKGCEHPGEEAQAPDVGVLL